MLYTSPQGARSRKGRISQEYCDRHRRWQWPWSIVENDCLCKLAADGSMNVAVLFFQRKREMDGKEEYWWEKDTEKREREKKIEDATLKVDLLRGVSSKLTKLAKPDCFSTWRHRKSRYIRELRVSRRKISWYAVKWDEPNIYKVWTCWSHSEWRLSKGLLLPIPYNERVCYTFDDYYGIYHIPCVTQYVRRFSYNRVEKRNFYVCILCPSYISPSSLSQLFSPFFLFSFPSFLSIPLSYLVNFANSKLAMVDIPTSFYPSF